MWQDATGEHGNEMREGERDRFFLGIQRPEDSFQTRNGKKMK